jgi:outer membrane protein assembly factor BamA
MFLLKKIGVALLLLPSLTTCAQTTLRLLIAPADSLVFAQITRDFVPRPQAIAPDTVLLLLPDSAAIGPTCLRLLQHLRAQSYLTASIDEGARSEKREARSEPPSSLLTPHSSPPSLHLGPALHWVRLRPLAETDRAWLEAAGFREKNFTQKPLRHDALLTLQRQVLEQFENNGYPFASVQLDSIRTEADGGISAVLAVQRNRFFKFKTLKISGDLKLPAAYLPNYLGLRPGQPYSRERVLRMREQLRSLLFVEMSGNPSVTFAGDEATINLFLQKKRASRFDLLIGLLPQPNAVTGTQRLLLTGSLSTAFQNALNLGERLSVELERLRPETQKLDVQAGVPYLFGSPFGAEGRLNIFKRDSTWVDAQADIGVQYLLPGGDFAKFFWENKSSSLQKVDTAAVRLSRRLPPNLDLRQNGFGLELSTNRLDYRYNPRRGWATSLKAVAGFNTVLRNSQIESLEDPAFDYASLYDTVTSRAARYRLEAKTELYLPVLVRSTLKIALRGGGIFSKIPVFANEQYRLGGNKLLRGFDEESLFATRWAVATAEYRLLLGQNSYLAVFANYGYLENVTTRTRSFLRPLGLGAGLNFETQAGIFGISMAVGRRDVGEGVDLRATKIHLGYVSLF